MFFDPQAHTSAACRSRTVVTGYHQAAAEGAELGIDADLIMCFLRDHSAESAAETLEASVPFQDWIIGVGLDSDERGNPPEKFAEVFARARELGYRLTMHCDIDQVGSIDNIRTVLQDIRTDRIDHGTNVVEDPALVDELRAARHRADLLPDLQPLRHRRHEGHRDRRAAALGRPRHGQLRRPRLLRRLHRRQLPGVGRAGRADAAPRS